MTNTFDWAGLTAEIVKGHFAKYPVGLLHLLRTRIEERFVPRDSLEFSGTLLLCKMRDEIAEATARAEAAEARNKVLEEALRALITEREGHFSTQAAWDAAHQALGAEHGK